jgi:hypothetical protein
VRGGCIHHYSVVGSPSVTVGLLTAGLVLGLLVEVWELVV